MEFLSTLKEMVKQPRKELRFFLRRMRGEEPSYTNYLELTEKQRVIERDLPVSPTGGERSNPALFSRAQRAPLGHHRPTAQDFETKLDMERKTS